MRFIKVISIIILVWICIPRISVELLKLLNLKFDPIIINEISIFLGSIVFISLNKTNDYGMKFSTHGIFHVSIYTLLIQLVTILTFVFLFVFKSQLPRFVLNLSLLQILFKLVILPALCEEVFMRGLVHGEFSYLKGSVKLFSITLSIPVILAAILFGGMHLIPIGSKNPLIFFTTTSVGLIAGYFREKSGSIFPAFITHASYNFWGFIPVKLLYLF